MSAIDYWGKLSQEFANFYRSLRTALNNPGDIPVEAQTNDGIASSMATWEAITGLDLTPFRSAFPLTVADDSLIGITPEDTFVSYPVNLPLGFARLDSNGIIPVDFLPPITGGLNYLGSWNASTNTPTLITGGLRNGTLTSNGDFFICNIGGTLSAIDGETNFNPGDQMMSDGTKWIRIPDNNSILSVNGLTGTVVLTPGIIGAQPSGNQLSAIQSLAWPGFTVPSALSFNGTSWSYQPIGVASGIATLNANNKLVQMPTAVDIGADSTGTAIGLMTAHNAQHNHSSFASQVMVQNAINTHESSYNHAAFLTESQANAIYVTKSDFSTDASVAVLSTETVDAAATIIGSYPLSINESITVSGHVAGKGVSGTNAGKIMFFEFNVSAINDNGEIRIVTSPGYESEIVVRGDISAGWSAIADINQGTDNFEIRVIGDAATAVRWKTSLLISKI
jgi:hypothetical protein